MINRQYLSSSVSYIQEKLGKIQAGTVGIVTGSGLGDISEALENPVAIPYADIPNLPQSTVQGHAGRLLYGKINGTPVIVLEGRVHLYEGYTAAETAAAVRILGELGVGILFVTNAAGALNPQFEVGTPMLITDHINYHSQSPLTGPNEDAWGVRFPDMSCAYDPELRQIAIDTALELGIALERGVYIQVPGPQLETPAETRMFRALGADAVGMSTVMEVIAAHHMGIRVLGMSCLTNKNLPDCMAKTTHEDVLDQASKSSAAMAKLFKGILKKLA